MPTVEYLNYDVLADHGWEVDDEDLFEKAAAADLGSEDYGTFEVDEGGFILDAAWDAGLDWPYSCTSGTCANCAVIIVDGEIEMERQVFFTDDEIENKDFRLTCCGTAATDDVRIIFNAKHTDYLADIVM